MPPQQQGAAEAGSRDPRGRRTGKQETGR